MGLTVDHLVDGSALARWPEPAARHRLEALLLGGRLALCSLTLLELGAAAPGGGHGELLGELGAAYRQVPVGEGCFRRAAEVQALLARRGWHGEVGPAALLVAVAAELAGLVVLHADPAFDRIGEVTGQGHRWVVPPGRRPHVAGLQ
jgi:predicted nucleic acid-binding protein